MRKRMLLLTLSAVTAITMTGCAGKKDGEEATTKPAVMAETSQVNTEKKDEEEVTTVTTTDEENTEESTEATSGEVEEDGYIEDHFADLYINGAQYKIDFNGSDEFGYPVFASPTLDEICERSGLVVQTDTEGYVYPTYLDSLPQTGAIRTGGLNDGIWIDPDMHVVTYVGEKAVTDLKVGDKILEINGNAYDENGGNVPFENGDDMPYEAGDYREFVDLAVSDVTELNEYEEKYDGSELLCKDVKLKVTDENGEEAERTADIKEGYYPAGVYVGKRNGKLKSIMIVGKEMENIASIGPMATGSTTREFMCGTYTETEYDEEKREGKYKNTSIADAGNSILTVWYDENGVMEAMKIEVTEE